MEEQVTGGPRESLAFSQYHLRILHVPRSNAVAIHGLEWPSEHTGVRLQRTWDILRGKRHSRRIWASFQVDSYTTRSPRAALRFTSWGR